MDGPGHVPVICERRHEATDGHDATVGKEFRHLSHASNVLLAISLAEAQVLVEASPDVVPIQAVCRNAAGHQKPLQLEGNRSFTGAREASQPNGAAAEATTQAQVLAAQRSGHMMLLLGYVCGYLQALRNKEQIVANVR